LHLERIPYSRIHLHQHADRPSHNKTSSPDSCKHGDPDSYKCGGPGRHWLGGRWQWWKRSPGRYHGNGNSNSRPCSSNHNSIPLFSKPTDPTLVVALPLWPPPIPLSQMDAGGS